MKIFKDTKEDDLYSFPEEMYVVLPAKEFEEFAKIEDDDISIEDIVFDTPKDKTRE